MAKAIKKSVNIEDPQETPTMQVQANDFEVRINSLQETIAKQADQIEKLLAAISSTKDVPAVKEDAKEPKVGITIQHIRPIRQWTIPKSKVIKIHRGTGTVNHPRFGNNIVLTPGCIVTVDALIAKELIKSKDFQKYGVER